MLKGHPILACSICIRPLVAASNPRIGNASPEPDSGYDPSVHALFAASLLVCCQSISVGDAFDMSSRRLSQFKKEHPFLGREFDWIATESRGLVGYFSTAGDGPVPEYCVLGEGPVENLFEEVMQLPSVCSVTIVDGADRNIADWVAVAERGLLAFDWSRSMSRYNLVALPNEPASAELLPEGLRMMAEAIVFEEYWITSP